MSARQRQIDGPWPLVRGAALRHYRSIAPAVALPMHPQSTPIHSSPPCPPHTLSLTPFQTLVCPSHTGHLRRAGQGSRHPHARRNGVAERGHCRWVLPPYLVPVPSCVRLLHYCVYACVYHDDCMCGLWSNGVAGSRHGRWASLPASLTHTHARTHILIAPRCVSLIVGIA